MDVGARSTHRQARLSRDGTRSKRPGRLASLVVEELANEIISGTWAEGTILPTEPTLCDQFGFSRTVVREGLKLLEERGLIRVEQGRGTTVQPRSAWDLLDPDVLQIALTYDNDMSLLDDLISVRRVLEQEMAVAAAGHMSDTDLAELGSLLDEMERTYDDYESFRVLDNAFHTIIMRASGNEIGLTIVRAIHRHGGVTGPLSATPRSKAALKRTAAEHRGIVDALALGDGLLAGERISEHIRSRWAERRKKPVAPDVSADSHDGDGGVSEGGRRGGELPNGQRPNARPGPHWAPGQTGGFGGVDVPAAASPSGGRRRVAKPA